MAFGGPADPIPSIHQFFALAEMPEVDDYERNLIRWHRERLLALSQAPTPAAWLSFYRELIGAIAQLSSRWAPPKQELISSPRQDHPQAAALGRLKDATAYFLQRWNVRIQDQSIAIKEQLVHQAENASIQQSESATHLTSTVSDRDRQRLAQYVKHSLASWSADVEAKLNPSWLRQVHGVISGEKLPWPADKPPPWITPGLNPNDIPTPHFPHQSVRRPTFIQSLMRAKSIVTMVVVTGGSLLTSLLIVYKGDEVVDLTDKQRKAMEVHDGWVHAVLVVISFFIGLAIVLLLSSGTHRDELNHLREEQQQRARQAIQSWVTATLEHHRGRMQTLLGSTATEMRSRMAEWVDVSWTKDAPLATPAVHRRDASQLSFSLNSIKSSLASRIAQLEYEQSIASFPANKS